jgi:hypothetical protein
LKDLNISRLKAAIELLEHKALEQMCDGKTTCTLNEKDVNEVLLVAGFDVLEADNPPAKELEVIGCSNRMTS